MSFMHFLQGFRGSGCPIGDVADEVFKGGLFTEKSSMKEFSEHFRSLNNKHPGALGAFEYSREFYETGLVTPFLLDLKDYPRFHYPANSGKKCSFLDLVETKFQIPEGHRSHEKAVKFIQEHFPVSDFK